MAKKTVDKFDEVLQGLDELVQAGRVKDVEQVLTTLIDSEPAKDPTSEERKTRSYAQGMRDGISLARGLTATESESG